MLISGVLSKMAEDGNSGRRNFEYIVIIVFFAQKKSIPVAS